MRPKQSEASPRWSWVSRCSDRVPDDVALEAGLLGAAPPDLDHRLEPGRPELARCLEAVVGVVDVGLLGLQIGMDRQLAFPLPTPPRVVPIRGMGQSRGPCRRRHPVVRCPGRRPPPGARLGGRSRRRRARSGVRWVDQPGAGPADLLDGQHHPWLGVVVVVADRHRPRRGRDVGVLGDGRILGRVERVVVDRSPHVGNRRVTTCHRTRTLRSCAPAGGSRRRGCRCGSCARRAGRCPSTGRSGARAASSTRSRCPTWPPRSRSSRSGATASTPRSSTPTSSCRSPRSASAST